MQRNLKKPKNKKNKTRDSKKNIILLSLVLCVLIVFVFIIRNKDEGAAGGKKRVASTRQEVSLVIEDLLIEPEAPRSNTIIRIIPVLKKKPRGTYGFKYRWFVNGKEIPNADKNLLPPSYRIRNNKVYCRVTAIKGKQESKEKKSKTFVIANSPPQINHRPVGEFSVPGDFSYQIDAFDPDGDRLEFNLLAPLGMGIELDSLTGNIRWSIPPLPQEKTALPVTHMGVEGEGNTITPDREEESDKTKIRIIVEVRDGQGGVSKTGIFLDLKRGREIGI